MLPEYFPLDTHFKNIDEIASYLLQNPKSKIIWVVEKSKASEKNPIHIELINQVAIHIENFLSENRGTGGPANQIFKNILSGDVNSIFRGEQSESINVYEDIFFLIPHEINAAYSLDLDLRNYLFEVFKKEKPSSSVYHVVLLSDIFEGWKDAYNNKVEVIEPNVEAINQSLSETLNAAKNLREDLHRKSNQFEENSLERKFKKELEELISLLENFSAKISEAKVTKMELAEISKPYIGSIRKFLGATQEICNEADHLRDSPTGAFVMTSLGTGLLVVMGATATGALVTSAGVFASKHLPKKIKFWENN